MPNNYENQKSSSLLSVKIIIGFIILMAIVLVLYFLLRGNTTTTNNNTGTPAVFSGLHCTASDIENSVFDTYGATSVTYTIDATFSDDQLDSLGYSYTGQYDSAKAAERADANIQASVNKYLYGLGVSDGVSALTSHNYSLYDTEYKILFSVRGADLTAEHVSVLLLEADAQGNFPKTLKEVKANYTSRSFVCSEKS